jgi:hypothetical protein
VTCEMVVWESLYSLEDRYVQVRSHKFMVIRQELSWRLRRRMGSEGK